MVWNRNPIPLSPRKEKGSIHNRIEINIDVPTDRKGLTNIYFDYDWLNKNGVYELEFKLSDNRAFGWMSEVWRLDKRYGTNEGVSGSPVSVIKISNVDNEPIEKIKISVMFDKTVTETEVKNMKVTAEYVIEE